MATARHFGVKPTSTSFSLPGYTDESFLLVQNAAADQNALGELPGNAGVVWYVGPDESINNQIIAYTIGDPEAGDYPKLFNSLGDQGVDGDAGVANTARIAFKGSGDKAWTNEEFIAIVLEIAFLNGDDVQETISAATTYISNGSFWTNFQPAAQSGITTTQDTKTTRYNTVTYRVTNEGEEQTFFYFEGEQEDINNPQATEDSPLGAGQTRTVCSLDSSIISEYGDLSPYGSGTISVTEIGESCL